jgi:hypothetical protein
VAGTTTQAQLGLVISAKDEASKIFEEFAKNITESMKSIQEQFTKGFNMDAAVKSVQEASKLMTEALGNVKKAEGEIGSVSYTSLENQMKTLAESVTTMSETVSKGFGNVARAAGRAKTEMSNMTSHSNFGEALNAGMIMSGYGEKITGFMGEAVKAGSEFDQSIKNTTASLNANLPSTKLSSAEIQKMSDHALDLGKSGFYSANQVSEAMNTLAKQGVNYNTIMGGAIDTVYKVAAANQADLEETANVVADIYNEMQGEFTSKGESIKQSSSRDR